MIGPGELVNRFSHHVPPNAHVAFDHEHVRDLLGEAAHMLDIFVPAGREKALALTKLEEAMMWANAAIARNPGGQP